MSEFFKQLIGQISAVWQKLSLQQKIISSSIVAFTFFGIITLIIWSNAGSEGESGYTILYSNLEISEAGAITENIKENGKDYKLKDDGRTILVKKRELYEVRMSLAREGLPASHGVGYEIFDKTNFGMTDFVQKLNARRALEGELQRTVEGLEEVKSARVHIVLPKESVFLDEKEDAKASVVIKTLPGRNLVKNQIRGITHLVSSSVEGLSPQGISVVDYNGKLLSNPYGDDETALASSKNMELQHNVEKQLKNKINKMLTNVYGPGKTAVQVKTDLDFDQVERTLEQYDPEKKVVRSEEISEENIKNAPDGDRRNEHTITNYEIDKSLEHIIKETGNIKKLSASVAIDGKYTENEDGSLEYTPREESEIQKIESMVKNAIGYDLTRGDEITVTSIRFDNEYLRKQRLEMEKQERIEFYIRIAKYAVFFLIAILLILFFRYFARTMAEAMNPPVPGIKAVGISEEEPVAEVPGDVRHTNELLDRIETMTNEEPLNMSSIIRQWLKEPQGGSTR